MKTSNTQLRQALLFAASAAAIGWAAPAFAQETPAQAAASDAGETTVNELVVTARRVEENLQDVPISVSAISAQRLENLDATDITTLQYTTPNSTVQVARGSNSTLIAFIRGVGQQDPLWGFEPGVGLYIDDVYIARPQAAVLDVFDVQRIEVLRGPQGTLYGRNTIGGAIKYVTREIGDQPEFHGKAEYGSFNQLDWLLSARTPIIEDKLGGSVAIARFTRDGYGENLFTGADQYDKNIWAARGALEFTPTEDILFKVSADITRDDSNPRHGHREVPTTGVGGEVLDSVYDTQAGIGDFNHVEARGISLLGQWDFSDNLTFKSITAYRAGETDTVIDFDNTPRPLLDIPAFYADHQFTQELQVLYSGERLKAVAGFFYLNSQASGAFDTIVGNLGVNIATSGFVNTRSWAVFGNAAYDLTDQLAVELGLRYTHDDKEGHVLRQTYLGAFLSPVQGGPARNPLVTNTNYTNENDFGAFTPRASVSYKFNDDLTTYVAYSRGFKSGGFDMRGDALAFPGTVNGYEPEYVDSFEVGLKGSLWERRINFATDLFYAKYKDVQITTQYPTATGVASVVDNVGQATFWGWEFEGSARFTDNLRADVALGYINGEFNEYLGFVPGAPGNGFACAANPPSPPVPAGCFVDFSNVRDIQNTPDWTASFSLTWTADVAGGQLAFTPLVAYRGDFQMFETASAIDQEGYWLVDANLSWTSPDGRYTLGLHGKNLTDETYRTGGYTFAGPVFGDSINAFYGPPRTVSVSLDVRL